MGRVTYWVMSTAYAIEEQCYKRSPDEQEGGMDEYFFEERGGVFLLLIILYKLKEIKGKNKVLQSEKDRS